MQGKGCFNFTQVDAQLFAELKKLAARAISSFGAVDWDAVAARRQKAKSKAKTKKTKRVRS